MYLPQGTALENRYVIEGLLGHGGFGITYAAYDQSFGARVAIKEYLPRHLATRGEGKTRISVYSGEARRHFDYGLKKFMEEAQLLAQFGHHPNVVSARDYFEANGTAYMVMEYAEGVTLKEYLEKKGGRIAFDEARGIMMPVMDALREVHQVGLLHRDISPDNIYITTAAQVRVIDFGAARYFAGEQSKSLSVILKSGYAPEEQYRSSGKQGPWTDVYAVGATLYKLITGQTPPDALDRMAGDTLEPPSRLGVAIPPAAEKALLQALAVNAGQRFHSMGEFQQAFSGGAPKPGQLQPAPMPLQQPSTEPVYTPDSAPSPAPVPASVPSQPPPPSPYPQAPRRSANPGAIAAGIVGGVIGLILVAVIAMQLIPWLMQGWSDPNPPKKPQIIIDHTGPPKAEEPDLHQEAEKLSEKIRMAHLNKDINKWLSCYHSSYPNLGRLENKQLELWKNYDIKEVSYRISNVQRVSDKNGSADIVWNIQLYDHRTHDYTLVRQSFKTSLEQSPGGWKIANSKEVAGTPFPPSTDGALMSMDTFTPIVQGYDLIRKGEYDLARNQFAMAVNRDRNNPFALNNLAVLKEREGKMNDALTFLKDGRTHANEYLDKVTQTCFAGGGSLAIKPLRQQGDRSSIAPIIQENINKIEAKITQESEAYKRTLRQIEETEQKERSMAYAEPLNRINFLNSSVDGPLKLFNGGTGQIPEKNRRNYMNRFPKSDNIFITWELNLKNNNINNDKSLLIKTVINKSDGSIFIRDATLFIIKNGWQSSWHGLRINKSTLHYKEGYYIMNLYCEDKKIASAKFEVY